MIPPVVFTGEIYHIRYLCKPHADLKNLVAPARISSFFFFSQWKEKQKPSKTNDDFEKESKTIWKSLETLRRPFLSFFG